MSKNAEAVKGLVAMGKGWVGLDILGLICVGLKVGEVQDLPDLRARCLILKIILS